MQPFFFPPFYLRYSNYIYSIFFRRQKQYISRLEENKAWVCAPMFTYTYLYLLSHCVCVCRNASSFSGLLAHKLVAKYACCPNAEYDHVLFTLHIRRRTIYYLVNLIAPCILLASMTLLEFLLPNECGEKLTLGTVSASSPPAPRAHPYPQNEFFAL